MKKIVIGSDHAGYAYKEKLALHLKDMGYDVINVGCDSEESCHYPVFAHRLCKTIQDGVCEMGILICGTGIGMSMAANKHNGIRAAVCTDRYSTELTRQHNNANVICMGARMLDYNTVEELTELFLSTDFMGGKHETRINMIADIENGKFKDQ